MKIVAKVVMPGTIINTDEAPHWDALHAKFDTRRINHQVAYVEDDTSTNQAESYSSGLRRMIRGTHHYACPQYLYQYAEHAAWLEDYRRKDNGALTQRMLGLALTHPVSREWKGYWKRNLRSASHQLEPRFRQMAKAWLALPQIYLGVPVRETFGAQCSA